jgi:hypothetical protein
MSLRGDVSVHIWNRCHACGAAPIVGLRFACQTCPTGADNDLCQACYHLFEQGRVVHPSPEAREARAGRHIFRSFEGSEREQVVPWLAVPWSVAPAPTVPDRFVVRPEFRSGRESFFGAYGFVVADDGRNPLMLTALHVLDELAKFNGVDCTDSNMAYTGRELPNLVTSVQLYDLFAPKWMLAELGTAGDMLPLPDARIGAIEPYSQRDVAAFRVAPSASIHPLRLAAAPPAKGEPIWLAINRGGGLRERTVQAIAVEITGQTLIFRFAAGATMPPHTSGAPLLNRAGDVVGINVGCGMLEGNLLGHGAHVSSVRRHLGW